MSESYCIPCKRPFSTKRGLQMHMEKSKIHKSEVRKQTRSQEVTNTRLPSVNLKPPPANPLFQSAHQHGTALTALIPDFYVEGNSGPIGCEQTFYSQTPIGLELHPENSGISVADLAIHLPLSGTSTNGYPVSFTNAYPGSLTNVYPGGFTNSNPSSLILQQPTKGARATIKHGNNYWSQIPDSQYASTLEGLSRHCHSSSDLQKSQYVLSPYGADFISARQKCKNCHRLQRSKEGWNRGGCSFHPGKLEIQDVSDGSKLYSCCRTSGFGCISLPTHNYGDPDPKLVAKYRLFTPSPAPAPHLPKRRAVALDCEMAGGQGGTSELILVCMVDFLSGESLVNTLVQPTGRIVDWRTRYSGVTRKEMAAATARGNTLNGWRAARAALWEHIDADTILVGQSLQNDLDVLRMIHIRVVDSGIIARNAVGPTANRQWGLKTLCQELLDIEIQTGRKGHDCMEDTLAAREVVLWCIERPQELAAWGLVKKQEEGQRQKELIERARKKRAELEEAKKKIAKDEDEDEDDHEDEVLHWSDIAEDCGWPHPDTGYDPWSD